MPPKRGRPPKSKAVLTAPFAIDLESSMVETIQIETATPSTPAENSLSKKNYIWPDQAAMALLDLRLITYKDKFVGTIPRKTHVSLWNRITLDLNNQIKQSLSSVQVKNKYQALKKSFRAYESGRTKNGNEALSPPPQCYEHMCQLFEGREGLTHEVLGEAEDESHSDDGEFSDPPSPRSSVSRSSVKKKKLEMTEAIESLGESIKIGMLAMANASTQGNGLSNEEQMKRMEQNSIDLADKLKAQSQADTQAIIAALNAQSTAIVQAITSWGRAPEM